MCRDCCKETVFIEIADGVTAQVTYNREDYNYAERDGSLLDVEVVRLMMTTEKLDELMENV
jgi:hypothetical protein